MKGKKGLIGTLFSYLGEIIFLALHIAVFYTLPPILNMEDSAKVVTIQFFLTFILGLLMGGFIRKRSKFYYGFAAVVAYLPSIFIIFSKENISYCLWIFIASFLGIVFGQFARKPKLFPKKLKEKKQDDKKAKKQAEKDKAAIEALDSLNEMNKVGESIPAEFDIEDSDVVPDVQTPTQESFGKRFLKSLKRSFAEKKEQKKKKKAKRKQKD